jgi:molybdopterin converting factor small subunit
MLNNMHENQTHEHIKKIMDSDEVSFIPEMVQ